PREVRGLHQRDLEAPLGRLPRRRRSLDAAPHHHDGVLAAGEGAQVPAQGHASAAWRAAAARAQSSRDTSWCVTRRSVRTSMAEARTPAAFRACATSGAVRPERRATTMLVDTGLTST